MVLADVSRLDGRYYDILSKVLAWLRMMIYLDQIASTVGCKIPFISCQTWAFACPLLRGLSHTWFVFHRLKPVPVKESRQSFFVMRIAGIRLTTTTTTANEKHFVSSRPCAHHPFSVGDFFPSPSSLPRHPSFVALLSSGINSSR